MVDSINGVQQGYKPGLDPSLAYGPSVNDSQLYATPTPDDQSNLNKANFKGTLAQLIQKFIPSDIHQSNVAGNMVADEPQASFDLLKNKPIISPDAGSKFDFYV